MKNTKKVVAAVVTISLLGGLSHQAQGQFYVYDNSPSITSFTATSLGTDLGGSLAFNTTAASPSGATIAGGASQGFTGGTATGETFYWSGATATLGAFALVPTGSASSQTYQPFLFDLGSSLYNLGSTVFQPGNEVNLLATENITVPGLSGGDRQLEIDIAGGVTLTSGESYAIGLQNTSGTFGVTLDRSSGAQSDPDGVGFTFSGGLSSMANDNSSPFSGSPRDLFLGLYTETVPEPSTIALGVIGTSALLLRRRK
jgi:hypothetical protein